MNQHAKLTPRNTDILKDKMENGGPVPLVTPPPSIEPKEPNLGTVATQPKPLKVALVGTAPSSRLLAPFADPTWTIWACSPGNMNQLPRVDAWFEIHNNLLWPECRSYGEPYVAWLKQQSFPIYMQDQSLVPNAIPYPIQDMVQKYGKYFFTSSFAYMMALAMDMGCVELSLFGIDMASKDEYILQRPGGHYFMQLAAQRGIKVSLPYESDLAQPPALYGYGDSTPFGRKMLVRKQELTERVSAMKKQRDDLNHGITYLEGALEDNDYTIAIWGGVQN